VSPENESNQHTIGKSSGRVFQVGGYTPGYAPGCGATHHLHLAGVDNSSVLNTARAVVEENNMHDVVNLIPGKIEEVELPVEKST
jgi:hypothetical protein